MNKKIKLLVGLVLSVSTLFGLFALATPASAASCNSRTITGYVITNGTDTRARFTYGTDYYVVDAGNGIATPVQTVLANQDQNIEAFLTGLAPSTQYFYRLEVTNQYGTAKLNIENFTTPACSTPNPTNTLPQGYLDGASCDNIWGWSIDFDSTSTPVNVQIYKDGPSGSGTFVTSVLSNMYRPDVNSAYNLTGNHAFNIPTPSAFKDTSPHTVYAYGVDVQTGTKVLLSNAPRTISACVAAPAPTCQDPRATNYGGPLPCQFPPAPTCQDPSATNYGGSLPCRYPTVPQTCQDPNATNYGGSLPCVYPQAQNPTVTLTANPTSVSYGGSSVLTWSSTNATSCTASGGTNGWAGSRSLSGTFGTGSLTSTTTYFITCSNSTGSANASATVNVGNQNLSPTVTLTANPTSIQLGQNSTLTWNSQNATSCSAFWTGSTATSGSGVVVPSVTTTYSITCYGTNGQQASAQATVNVGSVNNNVSVNLTADDTSINEGDETELQWTSNNASYCNRTGGRNGWSLNNVSTSGNFDTGDLFTDTTYSITCYNNAGNSATDSVIVRVEDDNDNNDDEGPDVTTRNATNVTTTSATLNGRVDGNGLSTRAWFEYGTNTNLNSSTPRRSYGSGSTSYDDGISGLSPNTTYYFRAVAENSEDTAYGSILSFNTGTNYIYYPPTNNQPTVVIYADSTNLSYNSSTTIRWSSNNATSCFASGGSAGWSGTKSIGPASFYTGSLTSSRTYTITCSNSVGSSTDSVTVNVRGRVISNPVIPTSYVIITSSVDRNQPIVPTIDNTRPHPGDEINYTVSYQNVGNASITGLTLRIDLPYEVDYMFSNPNNPTRSGNTLIFNLGTLKANGQGTVTVRVRVRENAPAGALLNFPATLSYTDPAGFPQSVSANVSAQVWSAGVVENEKVLLGATAFGAGFLPSNLFGWLLLLVLILILVLLAKYLFGEREPAYVAAAPVTPSSYPKRTTTTVVEHL